MHGSFGVDVMRLTRLPLWSRQFHKGRTVPEQADTHCIYQTLTCKTALELNFSQLNWSAGMFGACIASFSVRIWSHPRYCLCGFSLSLSVFFCVLMATVTKNFEIMHSSLVCCLFCGSFVNHILCLFHWKSQFGRNIRLAVSIRLVLVNHWAHVQIVRIVRKYSHSRQNATHFNLIFAFHVVDEFIEKSKNKVSRP